MLIDKQNQFSADAGDSPTVIGSTDSTNIIDLGVTRDIGDGATPHNLFLLAEVTTAFTSGGSATLQVQVATAPDSSGIPGAWVVLEQSAAIAVASLTQGYKFLAGGIPVSPASYRFLKLTYVIATATMTAGTIKAALVPSLDIQKSYPVGYTA
jgi:hypothetical protein